MTAWVGYRGTSLTRKHPLLGPYGRAVPRAYIRRHIRRHGYEASKV